MAGEGEFLDALPWAVMDGAAWIVVLFLLGGAFLERRHRTFAGYSAALGWSVFAVFWLAMAPHFVYFESSLIKGVLSLVAVPACLYTAYLLATGRDSLLLLSRSVAFMGVIYLPFITIAWMQQLLIETVARHVEFVLNVTGVTPDVVVGERGYRNGFEFVGDDGTIYRLWVILACTGIGATSIFGGLIAAVDAPLNRKLLGLAVIVPIIWILNLARVSFIAVAHGHQWFAGVLEGPVMLMFATNNANRVSFLIADKILAQSLSVVALVALTFALVRIVPELVTILEDATYLLTGTQYDLASAMGVTVSESADAEPR